MRIACTIQYEGSAFVGFQVQPNGLSVQEALEKAVSTIARAPIKVHGAGRTDSGVHAYGMVIHFELEQLAMPLEKFLYGVNSVLPKAVSIIHGQQVGDDFHARFSCTGREYVYRVLNSPYRMALYENQSHWQRKYLDLAEMKQAAQHLQGEHDFAAFTMTVYKKAGETTVRRIDNISILRAEPFLLFYYKGSGFLHNMIRIITGTLLEVGLGERSADDVQHILQSQEREKAGVTLPAQALFFYRANYDEYETPLELLPPLLPVD